MFWARIAVLFFCLWAMIVFYFLFKWRKEIKKESEKIEETVIQMFNIKERKKKVKTPPDYVVDVLPINPYSREGTKLPEVNSIFVHYTANAGTTAAQNRSYFETLKDTHERSVSSHFIIGIEGEIIQCLPLAEIGYAVRGRNFDSISIECCYEDENGKFTDATYESLVHLTAWLIGKYDLETEDILRHYDSNGKNCPKYYVEHERAWEKFHKDVDAFIEEYGEDAGEETSEKE